MSWRLSKKETHGEEGTKFKRRSKTINFRREIKKLNKKYGEDNVSIAMRALSKDDKFIKLPIESQLEILKQDLKIRASKT
jgi:hypothetical protein